MKGHKHDRSGINLEAVRPLNGTALRNNETKQKKKGKKRFLKKNGKKKRCHAMEWTGPFLAFSQRLRYIGSINFFMSAIEIYECFADILATCKLCCLLSDVYAMLFVK